MIARLRRAERFLGRLVARDLGLRERILRDVARALGGELRVQRLLQLDLDLREPALELLAIALGALVLLGEPLAIGLDLLELDAELLDVGRHPHHVVGLTAAAARRSVCVSTSSRPSRLFSSSMRDDLRRAARRVGRRLVALGLELARSA